MTTPEPSLGELDRSLVRGVAWTGGAKWASQLFAWASTLIVARLLTPGDYGLVGMAAVYLGMITLVSEFGLGFAVVMLRHLSTEQVSQLNGLAGLLGTAAFVLSCVAAIPLGDFFHAPQLPAVVMVMSAGFLITAFQTVPAALLQREMRFRALALVEASRAALLAVSMIAFALAGLGYWTLVIGGLVSATLATGATLALRRHALAWPRRRMLTEAITFSRRLLVARVTWYAYTNADFLIAGRILGTAALGVYSFAWSLASIPIEKIASLVGQVTPAVFSAVQKDPAALRRYLLRTTEGLAILALPASLGLALVASDLVHVMLGEKWSGAVAPLQLLALGAGLRAVTPLLSQVLLALGETRRAMQYGLLCLAVLPVGFYLLGNRWGTVGLALVWVTVFPILVLPAYFRVLRRIELSSREYLRALWPAVSASLLMGASVLAVKWAGGDLPRAVSLSAQVGAGVLVYGLACLAMHGQRMAAFSRVLRSLRERPAPQAPVS